MRHVKGKKQGIFQEEGIEYSTVKWMLSSRSQPKMMAKLEEGKAGQSRDLNSCVYSRPHRCRHTTITVPRAWLDSANWPHHSQNCFHKASNTSFTLLNIDNCASRGKAMVDKTASALAEIKKTFNSNANEFFTTTK